MEELLPSLPLCIKSLVQYIYSTNHDQSLENSEKIAHVLKLYIDHNPNCTIETRSVYINIFTICTTFSSELNVDYFIDLGKCLYQQHPDFKDLRYEIIMFFCLYDNDNINEYIIDFIKECYDLNVHLDVILNVFIEYTPLTYDPIVLDIALHLLENNLDRLYRFNIIFEYMSSCEFACNYICQHPITQNILLTVPWYTPGLALIFYNFTTNENTQIGCEFFYTRFVKKCNINSNRNDLNDIIICGLSNIVSKLKNFSFIDMNHVTLLLTQVLIYYSIWDNYEIYEFLYCIINNLHKRRTLYQVLENDYFINALKQRLCLCISRNLIYGKFMQKMMFVIMQSINMYPKLHYLFSTEIGQWMKRRMDVDSVEWYMNCSLQQKAGLVAYKHNLISLDELDELGIIIYTK